MGSCFTNIEKDEQVVPVQQNGIDKSDGQTKINSNQLDKNQDENNVNDVNKHLKSNVESDNENNFVLSDTENVNSVIADTPDTINVVDTVIDDELDQKTTNKDDDNFDVQYQKDTQRILNELKLRKFSSTIYDYHLIKLIDECKNNYIIIDVRDPQLDYPGGHIVNGVNIEYNVFINNIPNIIKQYNNIQNIIIHCMYSQSRGPTCCQWYCLAIECLLKNYGKNKNEQQFDQCTNQHDDFQTIKTINLDQDTYNNLVEQNIMLLKGGFRNFVNKYKDNNKYVIDFDMKHWELCNIGGKRELYHRNDW